jgi:DNA-binding GntR family transcriptional regulator
MATSFKSDLPEASASLRSGRPRLHDLAYAYLKDLLFHGGLEPGDQISTEGVGRALSVSRAPVTDAIRRLTVEGLLEVHPQVGCRVVSPVPAEVADFYQLFAATEGVIARMAAERRTSNQAEGLRELLAMLAHQGPIPGSPEGRRAEHRRRNRRRYERLHELANTPMSTAIAESFWDRSDFFIQVAFGEQELPAHVTTSHDRLFQAVIDGDGDTAEHQTRQSLSQLGHDVALRLGHID